jgi:GAF domain-containing protein
VLARISTKIRGAVSIEQVLQVATQEVRQATRAARSVAIIEPNEETMTLQPVSGRDL